MKQCIYCDRDKDEAEFSDEHIWPDALGGDYLPPDLWRTEVCKKCNNLSGLYVDGAFIKSWAGIAERATGALEYLSPTRVGLASLPLNYIGQLEDLPVAEGEIAEYWVGPCGANIVHIRPDDRGDDWSTYAGGDPRAKKLGAGRAYMSLASESPFWVEVSLRSFKAHFRKARRFVTNASVPPALSQLVEEPNLNDPVQSQDLKIMDAVRDAGYNGCDLHCWTSTTNDLGTRLLVKLALAIGAKTLGQAFLDTPYAITLRQGLWESNPEKRRTIPVRGSGYLSEIQIRSVPLSWSGGWVLILSQSTEGLTLSVVTPLGRMMHVLISDDPALLGTLDNTYGEGKVWITVPPCGAAAGPVGLPDFLAHQLGGTSIPELAVLSTKRSDPSRLPPCKPESGLSA